MKKISVVWLAVLVILINVTMAAADLLLPRIVEIRPPAPEKGAPAKSTFQTLKRPSCANGSRDFNCLPPPILPVPPMTPRIVVKPNYKPITVSDLAVKTDIIGNVAVTSYDMTMHNPNPAVLEAEFVFPLGENQNVASVALDINGRMREGVVVEKEHARKTFEAVVRRGADPLLVEKTAGNQFKTRIYPFAADGDRRIRIIIEESLKAENGSFRYVLPLQFNQKLKHFSLDIEVATEKTENAAITSDNPELTFSQSGEVIKSSFAADDYELNRAFAFAIPKTLQKRLFTHRDGDNIYFYGDIDVEKSELKKTLPAKIAVLWDSSLSGAKRDKAKEKELLKDYLKTIGDVETVFIPFNMRLGETRAVTVKNGDASKLLALIDDVVYDGATDFSVLRNAALDADEILLFTDGIKTIGDDSDMPVFKVPAYTVNSSAEYDRGVLNHIARSSYASFINLTVSDVPAALWKLTVRPLRLVNIKGTGLTEVYPVSGTEVGENLTFAGITGGTAELSIELGYDAENIVRTEKLTVNAAGDDNPAVARLWAERKMAYLEQQAKQNRKDILALGQKYSIVTDETSLLVLDSAADYLRYGIEPPPDLRDEYNALSKVDKDELKEKELSAKQDTANQIAAVKEWWQRKYDSKVINPLKKAFQSLHPNGNYVDGSIATTVDASGSSFAARAPRMTAADDSMDTNGHAIMGTDHAIRVPRFNSAAPGFSANEDAPLPSASAIKVKAWDPDTPYMKILKASKDKELYADYLKLKTGYSDQPSFYFDVTDEFIKRGMKDQALLVLSNIVEMRLDNAELMRIAANKLLQIKEYKLAISLFSKITELRGEDPQSWRDLALAYQANGDYEKAFDAFDGIFWKDWGRFNPIKQIIFVEINNLVSMHGNDLKTRHLSEEMNFPMPVDIRIVLSWSSDNTDIDLHVIDPNGEECFFNHKETAIGGRYAHDFTGGFGPEEFMLKKAVKGKYSVRTNNFGDHRQSIAGPTTVYLDIYTDYATPKQKHERVFVRTENVKEKNDIGEVVWK